MKKRDKVKIFLIISLTVTGISALVIRYSANDNKVIAGNDILSARDQHMIKYQQDTDKNIHTNDNTQTMPHTTPQKLQIFEKSRLDFHRKLTDRGVDLKAIMNELENRLKNAPDGKITEEDILELIPCDLRDEFKEAVINMSETEQ